MWCSIVIALTLAMMQVARHPASAQDYWFEVDDTRNTFNNRYGPILAPNCGTRGVYGASVAGGVPANLGDWPWMAALGYRDKFNPNKPQWLCGGSLISKRHVLTAGHCVYGHSDLFLVRLGELDLKKNNDGAHPIDVFVEKGTVHPQYSPSTYSNDIAVLRLQREVEFTDYIRPVCIPAAGEMRQKNLVDTFPFLAGWGSVSFQGPPSSRLQQVQVPIVSQQSCKESFKKFKTATIDNRILCAGYAKGGKAACPGDSGGPLMHRHGPSFYVVGVVSYSFKCARPGIPGVYSKTTAFLDFIIPLLN